VPDCLSPSLVPQIAEMFGYHSSREYALKKLAQAGGWDPSQKEPGVSIAEEGLRRPVSDMVLMLYHLIIPSLVPGEPPSSCLACRAVSGS
jgi:hypothetical protein